MAPFFFFLISGLILIFVEIFVPGGIFGLIGGILLLVSAIICFNVFGRDIGIYYTVGLVVFVALFVILSMSFMQHLPFRNRLYLNLTQRNIKVTVDGQEALLGKSGTAFTMLRPAGRVEINGKRYDAITEGMFIEKGTPVEVYKIESNHVIVRPKKT